jgi:hypothetical protein
VLCSGEAAINLKRGLLRAWVVIAVAWIGLIGWREYTRKPWNWDWGRVPIQTTGECWDRLAKWPDGQAFTQWDTFADEIDSPINIEINRSKHAWAADSILERNRWAAAIREKLRECQAAAPVMERVSLKAVHIWSSLENSLPIILLPPIALLIAGYIIGWVVRGFRAQA